MITEIREHNGDYRTFYLFTYLYEVDPSTVENVTKVIYTGNNERKRKEAGRMQRKSFIINNMKAKGYISEWDGLRYETLRAVKLHVWALTEKDRESLNGCPVLKDSGKLAGYIRIRYTRNGAAVPVIARN